jgi:membrane protein YqaA with SNARE-associated domain
LYLQQAKTAVRRAQRAHTLHWLSHLGLPGVFCISAIDSSPIPLPIPGTTDLLLLWLVAHRSGAPWLLVICAVAGSILGGYAGWSIGRKGGELALKRRVPARLLDPVHRWAHGNPFLSVFLPALLPPPVPLSPFVLAAGALGIQLRRFLIAFGAARALRYSAVAWLGATYGRYVIRAWGRALDKWSTPIVVGFAALFVAAVAVSLVKARRRTKSPSAASSAAGSIDRSAAD